MTKITQASLEVMYDSVKRQRIVGADWAVDYQHQDKDDVQDLSTMLMESQRSRMNYETVFQYAVPDANKAELQYFSELTETFKGAYLPDEQSAKQASPAQKAENIEKRVLFFRHFKDKQWSSALAYFGYALTQPADADLDDGVEVVESNGQSIGSFATQLSFAYNNRRQIMSSRNFTRIPNGESSGAAMKRGRSASVSGPLSIQMQPRLCMELNAKRISLEAFDMRRLIAHIDDAAPGGLDVCDLFSLYLSAVTNCRALSKVSTVDSVTLTQHLMDTTLNLTQINDESDRIFPFLKRRVELTDHRSPFVLLNGPTARQYAFTGKDFKEANLRHWKNGWFFVVFSPQGRKRLGRPKHARVSSTASLRHVTAPKYEEFASAEIWVYYKDDAKTVTKWIDKCYELCPAVCLKSPNAAPPPPPMARRTTVAQPRPFAMRPPTPNSSQVAQQKTQRSATDGAQGELRALMPPLPHPSKKIPLAHTIAYIDYSYGKHPNVFNFAKTGSSDRNEVLEKEGEQHHLLVFDSIEKAQASSKSVFTEELLPQLALWNEKTTAGASQKKDSETGYPTERQRWVTALNVSSAVSAIMQDIHKLLNADDVSGSWANIKTLLVEKCHAALQDVRKETEESMRNRWDEIKAKTKRHDRERTNFEIWVLDIAEITDDLEWNEMLAILSRANACPIVQSIVRTVDRIEKSHSTNALWKESLILLCMKLVYLNYQKLTEQVKNDIKDETCGWNQLQMSMQSVEYILHRDGAKEEVQSELLIAGEYTVENASIVHNPGAQDRCGFGKTINEAKLQRRNSALRRPPIPNFTGAPPASQTLNQNQVNTPASVDRTAVISEAPEPIENRFIASSSTPQKPNSWITRLTNPQQFKIQEQLDEKSKRIDWLRVEFEKCRVYSSVLSQMVVHLEMEIFRAQT